MTDLDSICPFSSIIGIYGQNILQSQNLYSYTCEIGEPRTEKDNAVIFPL